MVARFHGSMYPLGIERDHPEAWRPMERFHRKGTRSVGNGLLGR